MNLETYSQQFAVQHPETGEARNGALISAEQAVALGGVFKDKIIDISRKANLTIEEATFVDNTADLASRCISWGVEQKGMHISDDSESFNKLKQAAYRAFSVTPNQWPVEAKGEGRRAKLAVLNEFSGAKMSMRRYPDTRPAMEDYAMNAMTLFGEMVASNGGLELDDYLTSNIQTLLAKYEMAEASQA